MSIARFSCAHLVATLHKLGATRQITSRRSLAKMSQGQPRRPAPPSGQAQGAQEGAIRYGDVFPAVSGGLAKKPVAPQDAATMQSAETMAFGETVKGGPAATMQSAAMRNERMGVVGHDQATDVAAEQGVSVSETRVPGGRVVTEFVAGQAVGQYLEPDDAGVGGGGGDETKITIGEALEAAGYAAGTRPVERSDAAAIQAAEVRATGLDANVPGGLAAQAQSAADANVWATRDDDKATLGEVLSVGTLHIYSDYVFSITMTDRSAWCEPRARRRAACDGEAGCGQGGGDRRCGEGGVR
jgi:hypothetical protein